MYVNRESDPVQGDSMYLNAADNIGTNASSLIDWLGGTEFSVIVSCGGSQVAQLKNQSFGQTCIEGD